jgi:hypothetical protein
LANFFSADVVVGVEPAIPVVPSDEIPEFAVPIEGGNINRAPTVFTPPVIAGTAAGAIGFVALVIVIAIFAPRLKQALCGPKKIEATDTYQPLMTDA